MRETDAVGRLEFGALMALDLVGDWYFESLNVLEPSRTLFKFHF